MALKPKDEIGPASLAIFPEVEHIHMEVVRPGGIPETTSVADEARLIISFSGFIERDDYPCVGAKAAQSRHAIEYNVAGDIESSADDITITKTLQEFAVRAPAHALFSTCVVGFVKSRKMSELDFEKALWQRLQALHNLDRVKFGWDPLVSDDPQSPDFSVSVGGKGFYVIGVHPDASRMARRFEFAALVFNLHSQFEQLRADGRYSLLSASIVRRDIALSGTRNPMLARHGESSEARQYSGRQTRADWRCPFHATEKA